MKLGYITPCNHTSVDSLLVAAVQALKAQSLRLAGVVQHNPTPLGAAHCHMDLEILLQSDILRISQDLGALAKSCRLDTGALEQAVGLVLSDLSGQDSTKIDLLIINKFGKSESEGRGFRPVIAAALEQAIPVLIAVRIASLPAFFDFAADLGQEAAPELPAILAWAVTARE